MSETGSSLDEDATGRERWTGKQNKYRRLIGEERALWKSLQQLENDDLSLHLYNAHAIKRAAQEDLEPGQPKRRRNSDAKRSRAQKNRWVPSSRWTAWPLELEHVPTEQETWGKREPWEDEGDNAGLPEARRSLKPSAELEELLLAEMTRHAREEFRSWQEDENATGAEDGAEGHLERDEAMADARPGEDDDIPSEPSMSVDAADSATSGTLDSESNESSTRRITANTADYYPVVSVDDEPARKILNPFIRHILTTLDGLLQGLHRSRMAHTAPVNSRSRSLESSASREMRAGTQSPSGHGSDTDASQASFSRPSRQPQPRDWSEVLGMAALTGWDPQYVASAARRCSQLFGEGMRFQVLEQHSEVPGIYPSVESGNVDNAARADDQQVINAAEDAGAETRMGYKCPEKTCSSRSRLYKSRFKWLQHIKERHGYDYTGADLLEPFDKPKPKRQMMPEESFPCPESDCERHTWPYPVRWRLTEHLKKRHGIREQSRSPSVGISQPRPPLVGGEEMFGGVHVDGFMRPVSIRLPGRSRSVSRARSSSASSRVSRG